MDYYEFRIWYKKRKIVTDIKQSNPTKKWSKIFFTKKIEQMYPEQGTSDRGAFFESIFSQIKNFVSKISRN